MDNLAEQLKVLTVELDALDELFKDGLNAEAKEAMKGSEGKETKLPSFITAHLM